MGKKIKEPTKKRAKRIKIVYDIKRLKKDIKNELYNQNSFKVLDKQNYKKYEIFTNISKEEEDYIYNSKFTKYISEELNSSIVNMLVIYINKSKSFPLKYKNEPKFVNKLVNLLKHLLINQFEMAYFTILLDRIGWSYIIDHWIYFSILGIYTKHLCGKEDDSLLLMNIISRNIPEFSDYYTNWIYDESIISKIEEDEISIKLINERFRQLNKPINSYCRKNYISYNGMVDKIVKLSQPYGDESNGNQLQYSENNGIIDNNINKELKLNINEKLILNEDSEYNRLKYDLIMEPMISSSYSQKQKNFFPYENLNDIADFNNYNLNNINLNLINKKSSELSLKLENFPNV